MDPSELFAVWTPAYEVDIGPHVFPTLKYRRVREVLEEDGTLRHSAIRPPERADREDLERVHTAEYLDKVESGNLSLWEERILEVPFSPELREAFLLCCGGSILAGRLAVEEGVAVHLGGGFHHAFADHGEGFCLLNDVAVAVRALMARDAIRRAAVVDLDVHQGNGTAAIFQGDPAVFTFSMHQERNYPSPKPPGDLDVGLEDATDDETYLALLREHLPAAVVDHTPDLVFYLAGADAFHEDQLGGLGLTLGGLRERDRTVLEACRAAGVPVAVTFAGGYALRLEDTVEIHANTVREARAVLEEERSPFGR